MWDQVTVKKVIVNVQNIQENALNKFWVQLMRQNLLKHEKITNGPPTGLTDKSVPGSKKNLFCDLPADRPYLPADRQKLFWNFLGDLPQWHVRKNKDFDNL